VPSLPITTIACWNCSDSVLYIFIGYGKNPAELQLLNRIWLWSSSVIKIVKMKYNRINIKVVIGNDGTGSCKFNYHTTTTAQVQIKMKGYWYWWHLWLSLFINFLSISINEKNWFAESMFFVGVHWMEFVSHVKFRAIFIYLFMLWCQCFNCWQEFIIQHG
jgi:hypothetical protein